MFYIKSSCEYQKKRTILKQFVEFDPPPKMNEIHNRFKKKTMKVK